MASAVTGLMGKNLWYTRGGCCELPIVSLKLGYSEEHGGPRVTPTRNGIFC